MRLSKSLAQFAEATSGLPTLGDGGEGDLSEEGGVPLTQWLTL